MTAEKKKTGRCPKWDRPISKKFYDFIHYQIRFAEYRSETKEVRIDFMMQCIDEYIDNGSINADFNNTETVVFSLLRPYIDQAISRSRRAREAALRRREAKKAARSASAPSEVERPVQSESDSRSATSLGEGRPEEQSSANTDATSRAERRSQRREEARIRRHQKHAKRLQNRRKSPTGICQT